MGLNGSPAPPPYEVMLPLLLMVLKSLQNLAKCLTTPAAKSKTTAGLKLQAVAQMGHGAVHKLTLEHVSTTQVLKPGKNRHSESWCHCCCCCYCCCCCCCCCYCCSYRQGFLLHKKKLIASFGLLTFQPSLVSITFAVRTFALPLI